jgi:trigger factor
MESQEVEEQQTPQAMEEYRSDAVSFSVHRKPRCSVEFQAQISPEFTKAAYEKAVKIVSKHVSLPGFRKGRAPHELVIKKFAKEIDKEWLEELANRGFAECEKLANIPVLKKDSNVHYTSKSYSLEKGAELHYTFETEPTIPAVDPKQFHLIEVPRPPVTDKEIEETIRQVLFYFADWRPIKDRPAQEGDFVLLDVDVIETDPPTPLFSKTRFEVSDRSMAEWMKPLVIGLLPGASIEGVSTPGPEVPEAEKASYPPKKVRIILRAIDEAELPPMDEKFFQSLGVKDAEELRNSISRLLNEKADAHVKEGQRHQVIEFLLKEYPFDLPTSFISKETRFRMQQLLSDESFKSHWNQLDEQKQRETLQAIFDQSEKAVRLFYLCRRILTDAKVQLSPEDLPKIPTTPLEILVKPPSNYQHYENEELRQAESYSRLILEKAEDVLIEMSRA